MYRIIKLVMLAEKKDPRIAADKEKRKNAKGRYCLGFSLIFNSSINSSIISSINASIISISNYNVYSCFGSSLKVTHPYSNSTYYAI